MSTEVENQEAADTEDLESDGNEAATREFNSQICTAAAIELADQLIKEYGLTDSQLVVLRAYDMISLRIYQRLLEKQEELQKDGEDKMAEGDEMDGG